MSPKTGPRTAREAAWLKIVPRAMAEGLTGGRSVGLEVSMCALVRAAGDGSSRWLEMKLRL